MTSRSDELSLAIVHACESWVVVDKPPGLLSVPGRGESRRDCVATRVAALFPRATGPLIVHRLDMDTSGLMVLGLTPDSQRILSAQFERRIARKAYAALLDGLLNAPESGVIDLPMRLEPAHRPFQVIDLAQGRPAQTRWRILGFETDRTRVRLEPVTGRTHQLRLHCATPRELGGLGHAIVGDALYGSGYRGPEAPGSPAAGQRLMLHAAELEIRDPLTGAPVAFTSAPRFDTPEPVSCEPREHPP